MLNKGADAAFIHQLCFVSFSAALVAEDDAHAGIEEGQLAQAVLQRFGAIFRHGEGFRAGEEFYRSACIGLAALCFRAVANFLQRLIGHAAIDEAAEMLFAIAVDGQVQPNR